VPVKHEVHFPQVALGSWTSERGGFGENLARFRRPLPQSSLRLNLEELDPVTPGVLGIETTRAREIAVINDHNAAGKKAFAYILCPHAMTEAGIHRGT
jgi:hypothetical protein